MARAISEEPPSTSTDWGRPTASIMVVVSVLRREWRRPVQGAGARRAGSRPGPGGGLGGSRGAGRCTGRAFDRDRSGGPPRGRPGPVSPAIRRSSDTSNGRRPGRPASPWPDRSGPRRRRSRRRGSRGPRSSWWWPDREVEGQCPARHGERERTRVAGSEPLEHGQKRRQFELADPLDDPAHGFATLVWNHELVLKEPSSPVQPVPGLDPVQRVEEATESVELALLVAGRFAEPELVEQPHGEGIQQTPGSREGYPRQGLGPEVEGPFGLRAQSDR